MPKKLKIIIAIILALILALGIYIAPKVIPYTPPNPNIIKTDQGSFELKTGVSQSNFQFTSEFYKEYENYAKNYYSIISKVVKDKKLIVNSNIYIADEGITPSTITFTIDNNKNMHFFEAKYIQNNKRNFVGNEFRYRGFFTYSDEGTPQLFTLEELLKTPEYQNLKLN